MKTSIVLGTLFGDEGKGLTTSCLASAGDLVVRFNGGCQAGHTVEKDGYRHVFSSFGSGTLNGAHTYWSEHCAFYPKSYYNELDALVCAGFSPGYAIHPLAPVITPFDIDHNRSQESTNQHGSVGMGFGATMHRTQNTPHKLYAVDLSYPRILEHKLKNIAAYYKVENPGKDIMNFMDYCRSIYLPLVNLADIKHQYKNIVFEGAQGIMLDMDHGFFPHVTRSNTTSKNAIQLIRDAHLPAPDIYYVMRSYLTRHGNGWMPNEDKTLSFEDKTNVSHAYQGDFRQGYHCSDMLNYALECDNAYSGGCKKSLVISCLNQTEGEVLIDGNRIGMEEFISSMGMDNIYLSYSKTTMEKYERELSLN